MENLKGMETDERFERIQEQLIKFIRFDFSGRIPLSGKGDDIDAIILALNTLGEELSERNSFKNQ